MSQQYVLLREENDLLNSLIGQSFNQKSKFEAYKILRQIHTKADQYSMEKALCYIVDNGEIKGVGGSSLMQNKKTGEIISDLILDGFGEFGASLFKKTDGIFKSFSSPDITNTPRTFGVYGGSSLFNLFGSDLGVLLQVGQGSTVPARIDFNIETPFGTAPESGTINPTTNPVWNTSQGTFKQNISMIAGGAGTITESVLFGRWEDSGLVLRTLALFRDIISPGVAFIVGQTIALEYTVQF